MSKITRYNRRIKRIFISSSLVSVLLLFIFLPAIRDSLFNVSVDYYIVSINEKPVGTADSIEVVGSAMAKARLKYSREFEDVVLINPHFSVERKNVGFSERMGVDELSENIYSTLFENVVTVSKQEAYTVSVGDYSVNLASINDVAKLMDRLKERYDITGQFTTVLDPDSNQSGEYTVTFAKESEEKSAEQIVADRFSGNGGENTGSESDSGVLEIYFKDPVKVDKNQVDPSDIKSVADAYDEMSEKKDKTSTYYVQNQDTLEDVAKLYQTDVESIMEQNPDVEADQILIPGQILTINYSQSMVAVVTVKNMAFEEDYISIEYRDDNEEDYGKYQVIDEGSAGHRSVTAKVIYENGVQTGREILSENTTQKDSPEVILVGTKVENDDYVRPVQGGSILHIYGEELEKDRFNQGVDFDVNEGTSVVAASGGKVTRAGWFSNLGLMVEVISEDGTIFRYGYLGEVKVKEGDTVSSKQEIGKSGSTGCADVPSLHFDIIRDGVALNPLKYVEKK